MGKYDPLAAYLAASATPTVTLSITELELILGEPLPFSARKHREWWANNTTNHVNSKSWLGAGWRVGGRGLSMEQERVTFVKSEGPPAQVAVKP